MWSTLTVEDKGKAQAYLDCYRHQNCRSGTLASLRSDIKRSGHAHYLYEGDGFQLILCLGVKNRSGRHTMFDVSYSPGIDPDVAAPLFLDKFREYAAEHDTDEIDFVLVDSFRPEGVRMLLNIAQADGVRLTTRAAPPAFTEFTLTFEPVTSPS